MDNWSPDRSIAFCQGLITRDSQAQRGKTYHRQLQEEKEEVNQWIWNDVQKRHKEVISSRRHHEITNVQSCKKKYEVVNGRELSVAQ